MRKFAALHILIKRMLKSGRKILIFLNFLLEISREML